MRAPLTRLFRLATLLTLGLLFGVVSITPAEEPRVKNITSAMLRRTAAVEVVEKNKAAIVNIHSERTVGKEMRERREELMQTQQRVSGMGTGVIIDPRGYILTNHHVIDDVQMLKVHFVDGTTLSARVIAREPSEDLALIKVDPSKLLPLTTIGTATDLMLGESVIAIGNAFGYEHTVTAGVVSALKRDVTLNREVSYKSLIQTDASINPGNSGGPLFNIHGELIGINVAIRAGAQGIGFTIPVDNAIKVAADLISLKRRTGLAHGATIRDLVDTTDHPIVRWAVIEKIDANSPADRAGFKPGDVIERAGELKVVCALDFERAFIEKGAGDKVSVLVRRGTNFKTEIGEEIRGEIVLKTVDRAAPAPNDLVWNKMGLKVQPVAADQVSAANPQLHGGLVVVDVRETSPASRAGFQRGDILIGLHQWETINLDNVLFVINHPDLASFAPLRYFRIRGTALQRGWLPNLE